MRGSCSDGAADSRALGKSQTPQPYRSRVNRASSQALHVQRDLSFGVLGRFPFESLCLLSNAWRTFASTPRSCSSTSCRALSISCSASRALHLHKSRRDEAASRQRAGSEH